MRKLEIEPIRYNKSLREILFEDFKSIGKELPIKGGWGYSKEDAIVIDKNDPAAVQWQPFNGVALEYFIAEKRIFEEIIIFRSKGDQFRNVKITLNKQSFIACNDGKSYDYLIFDVTAFHDKDWESIDREIQEKINTCGFDFVKFIESKNDLRYHYTPEFWFEISSFSR